MRHLARVLFCLFVFGVAHPGMGADDLSPLFGTGDCAAEAGLPAVEQQPPVAWLGSCQAQEFCPTTCVFLGCSGTTCSSGTGYVICDGVRTNCPACNPPPFCVNPEEYCNCRQSCGGIVACINETCY